MRSIAYALLAAVAFSPAGASAAGQSAEEMLAAARDRLAAIERRAQAQQDVRDIENLQRIYGYYLDRGDWDQVTDLFAADGTIEFEQRGIYVGKAHIRRFLDLLGPAELREGHLDDHLQLQIVVSVAEDGQTAKLRARELNMGGDVGGSNHLGEGTLREHPDQGRRRLEAPFGALLRLAVVMHRMELPDAVFLDQGVLVSPLSEMIAAPGVGRPCSIRGPGASRLLPSSATLTTI